MLAELLTCLVIAGADGDTLTARCDAANEKTDVTVRLAGIDAPETGRAFGNRSKSHLTGLCSGKAAVAKPRTTNR